MANKLFSGITKAFNALKERLQGVETVTLTPEQWDEVLLANPNETLAQERFGKDLQRYASDPTIRPAHDKNEPNVTIKIKR